MSAVPNDLCCFRITVVASAIIALAWLALKKRRKKESQKIDDSSILATCRSGNLAILSSEALDNAWYGSLRPLTNLTQTFQACHLRTFNLGASFFPSLHMVYYRTPWGLPEPMFFITYCSMLIFPVWQRHSVWNLLQLFQRIVMLQCSGQSYSSNGSQSIVFEAVVRVLSDIHTPELDFQ